MGYVPFKPLDPNKTMEENLADRRQEFEQRQKMRLVMLTIMLIGAFVAAAALILPISCG